MPTKPTEIFFRTQLGESLAWQKLLQYESPTLSSREDNIF